MNQQQAIRAFDDHLVWMAKRRMINNLMLKKLSGALETLAESDSGLNAEDIAEINAANRATSAMKLLVKSCGITEKGMAKMNSLPDEFTDTWSEACRAGKVPRPNSDQGFSFMIMVERQMTMLAEADIATLDSYIFYKNLVKRAHQIKIKDDTILLRELFPRLQQYFNNIDNQGYFDRKKTYHQLYNYHVNKWN